MGVKHEKDFVTANAVENILAGKTSDGECFVTALRFAHAQFHLHAHDSKNCVSHKKRSLAVCLSTSTQ